MMYNLYISAGDSELTRTPRLSKNFSHLEIMARFLWACAWWPLRERNVLITVFTVDMKPIIIVAFVNSRITDTALYCNREEDGQ